MPKKEWKIADNFALTSLLGTGIAVTVIGTTVWLTNTDFGYDPDSFSAAMGNERDESDPLNQFIGAAMALGGTVLTGLGWATAAVCRFLSDR